MSWSSVTGGKKAHGIEFTVLDRAVHVQNLNREDSHDFDKGWFTLVLYLGQTEIFRDKFGPGASTTGSLNLGYGATLQIGTQIRFELYSKGSVKPVAKGSFELHEKR